MSKNVGLLPDIRFRTANEIIMPDYPKHSWEMKWMKFDTQYSKYFWKEIFILFIWFLFGSQGVPKTLKYLSNTKKK